MKPKHIKTEGGEELVVLARHDYEELLRAKADDEDAGTARIIERHQAAAAAGYEVALPAEVAEAIARGENPIRVIREWRGMTQLHLGEMKTNVSQSYISQLENGSRRGTVNALKALAKALQVPVDLLIQD
jgi:antitoxin component HigA of HigAB toxin-antitoxin module